MNFSLLEHIDKSTHAILVTVLSTEGHTYKKKGDKALYQKDSPFPVYGNLGTTCVDPHIIEIGETARRDGRPQRMSIDTTDPADIHLGTGTYCGGRVELLIEPILETHKRTYRQLRAMLENNEAARLVHNLITGDLTLSDHVPESDPNVYIELVQPGPRLCIFGATPLARHLIRLLDDTDFSIHVSDWQEGYLSTLKDLPRVTLHLDEWLVDADSFAILLSHHHERDLGSLREAIARGCRFIGLLSSTGRRDALFAQLTGEGFSAKQLQRVFSPVGVPIRGRSDAEIALSIAAQLIQVKNQ